MSFVMHESWSREFPAHGYPIWSYYVYCGKCGSYDISWTNQEDVEQENKRILAKKGREEGSCARILTIFILLIGLVIFNGYLLIDGYLNVLMRSVVYAFSVGVFLFVIYRSTTEWQWRQKIRTYKYRCEKCRFEFCHTFPKPQEDNPFGCVYGDPELIYKVMPTFVWVEDETKTINGADMRKGHTYIWNLRKVMDTRSPVTESEIQSARERYLARTKAYKVEMMKGRRLNIYDITLPPTLEEILEQQRLLNLRERELAREAKAKESKARRRGSRTFEKELDNGDSAT